MGFCAIVLPGLTWPFMYGSVSILAATAVFPAALLTLWSWHRTRSAGNAVAVAVAAAGLYLAHLSEAIALGLIALAMLGRADWARLVRLRGLVLGISLLALGVWSARNLSQRHALLTSLPYGSWDLGEDVDPLAASIASFLVLVRGPTWMALAWLVLFLSGVALALRQGLSGFPLRAFAVVAVLAFLAGSKGLPELVKWPTIPWYGQTARVVLMAGAPMAMYVGLALERAIAWLPSQQRPSSSHWARAAPAVSLLGAGLLLLSTSAGVVPGRRLNLEATLAGAGDTARIAEELRGQLKPGETVLGLEGDGTEMLFAYNRVPVFSDVGLSTKLGRLDDPEVAASLQNLKVRYLAIGTSSLHWGPKPGYSIARLLEQPQLSAAFEGTDMVVLRYEESR